MDKHLFDSQWRLMELVWDREPVSAKEISLVAAEELGWNKNTTYTVLKKLEEKGYLHRQDPGFICTSLIKREQAQHTETQSLIDRLYRGSRKAFLSAFLTEEPLSEKEREQLRKIIDGYEK